MKGFISALLAFAVAALFACTAPAAPSTALNAIGVSSTSPQNLAFTGGCAAGSAIVHAVFWPGVAGTTLTFGGDSRSNTYTAGTQQTAGSYHVRTWAAVVASGKDIISSDTITLTTSSTGAAPVVISTCVANAVSLDNEGSAKEGANTTNHSIAMTNANQPATLAGFGFWNANITTRGSPSPADCFELAANTSTGGGVGLVTYYCEVTDTLGRTISVTSTTSTNMSGYRAIQTSAGAPATRNSLPLLGVGASQ